METRSCRAIDGSQSERDHGPLQCPVLGYLGGTVPSRGSGMSAASLTITANDLRVDDHPIGIAMGKARCYHGIGQVLANMGDDRLQLDCQFFTINHALGTIPRIDKPILN